MKTLKVFAIGAEVTIVSTLAVSSYTIAFAGQTSTSWLVATPLATVLALESLRLPIAFNFVKSRLMGQVMSAALVAGLTVVTGEAATIAFENLIFQRTRPVVIAERALDKVEHARATLNDQAAHRDDIVKQLNAELETARAHRSDIDKPVINEAFTPQPVPLALLAPVPQPLPAPKYNQIKTKKGWIKVQTNQAEIEEVRKANEKAQSDYFETNGKTQGNAVESNRKGQEAVDKHNADLEAAHTAELQAADKKIDEADARLRAVPSAPNTQEADDAVKAAELAVDDARTMNPMFRVAAAWQKTPVAKLNSEQFEQVKHWAVIALAGATALVTALSAVITELPPRDGKSGKLNRTVRAWIARRRKPIVVHHDVPGPEVIKEVEVLRDVPGPEVIKEVEVFRDVPGPERIVEKEVVKEVPGPVEYRPAPGPIEYRDVPGPERVVERVVVKWVPYDVATGLRIKSDGSLGEVAQLKSVQ
jgi:hypothetical protein